MLVISPPIIGLLAVRLRALADPARIGLLLALQDGPSSVQGLADRLGSEHRNVSYNLNVLYREGIVTRQKDGKQALYELADYATLKLLGQAADGVSARVEELADSVLPAA